MDCKAKVGGKQIDELLHLVAQMKNSNIIKTGNQVQIQQISGGNKLHILLADDDEDDRQFFTDAVNSIVPSAKLSIVNDGEELISKLKKNKTELPDFIFLDLNMPFKNGLECLKEIKSVEFLKDIPILIYSTSINKDQVETTYRNGANMYIQKPASFQGIISMLNTIFSFDAAKWFNQPAREKFLLK